METTHDDEKLQTIEARQRSVLSQSGQSDPSGDTGTAGAIDAARPTSRVWIKKRGQPQLENITNADLRIPIVGARDTDAPEPDGRTNPCTEMLTQPLTHFEFQIHGRPTLLVPIDE